MSTELKPTANDDFQRLVGKTITGVRFEPTSQDGVVFETTGGPVYFGLAGDCCSESWWAEVRDLDNLIGRQVLAIVTYDIPVADDDKHSRQESDQITRYVAATEVGVTVFEWRNSSNGYYSGWLTSEAGIPRAWPTWPALTTGSHDWYEKATP